MAVEPSRSTTDHIASSQQTVAVDCGSAVKGALPQTDDKGQQTDDDKGQGNISSEHVLMLKIFISEHIVTLRILSLRKSINKINIEQVRQEQCSAVSENARPYMITHLNMRMN